MSKKRLRDDTFKEPPQQYVIDIEEDYERNHLYAVEYAGVIHTVLRTREYIHIDYMKHVQTEVKVHMRWILLDWICDMCSNFNLRRETSLLCHSLIDGFLSIENIAPCKLQLVGMACLFVAAKFHEIYPPDAADYIYMCDNAYDEEELLQMETKVLNTLQFGICVVTPADFIERYCRAGGFNEEMTNMVCYLIEMSSTYYWSVSVSPSMLVATCVWVVLSNRLAPRTNFWNVTLQHYTQYDCEAQLRRAADFVLRAIPKQSTGGNTTGVYRKHSKVAQQAEEWFLQ